MRVGLHVNAGRREEIEIDVAGDAAARAADIEIPAAEGKVERLPGIGPEGSGRLEQAAQALSEGQR
jgi:predicted NUDIX family NTP pyrophosphohydrolase